MTLHPLHVLPARIWLVSQFPTRGNYGNLTSLLPGTDPAYCEEHGPVFEADGKGVDEQVYWGYTNECRV